LRCFAKPALESSLARTYCRRVNGKRSQASRKFKLLIFQPIPMERPTCVSSEAIVRFCNVRIAALFAVFPLLVPHPVSCQTPVSTGQKIAKVATSGKTLLRDMDRRGISFHETLIFDWSKCMDSDDAASGFGRYSFDVSAAIDGKKLLGLGGSAALLRLRNHLNNFGENRVGAAQLYSNIDAGERTELYEAWMEQRLLSNKLRLKGGKVDANTEFDTIQTAGDFLNASMGYSPTIVAFPSYPEPKLGLNAFLQPSAHNALGVGFFRTATSGPLSIIEPSRTWTVGRTENQGRVSIGYWHLAGDVDRFDGGKSGGTQGFYSVAEQTLWRASQSDGAEHRVSAFFQIGSASAEVSPFARHVGGGAVLQGTWGRRAQDSVGLAATRVRFSTQPGAGFETDNEFVIESYYKAFLTRHFSLVPDFQLIHHPGGSLGHPDCPIFTSRFVASF
jgi:porin